MRTVLDYSQAGAAASRLSHEVSGMVNDLGKMVQRYDRLPEPPELLIDNLMKVIQKTVQARMDLESIGEDLQYMSRLFDGMEESSIRLARKNVAQRAVSRFLSNTDPRS